MSVCLSCQVSRGWAFLFPGIVVLGMLSRSEPPGAGWSGAQACRIQSAVNKQEVAGEGPGPRPVPSGDVPEDSMSQGERWVTGNP